jgi:23S rRNA-intervening sequence protein
MLCIFGTAVRSTQYSVPSTQRKSAGRPDAMAQHFKDLVVWQRAMDMVTEIYKLTDSFPKHEVYSLTNQIRRAAVSVPSNIAEGQAHYSRR